MNEEEFTQLVRDIYFYLLNKYIGPAATNKCSLFFFSVGKMFNKKGNFGYNEKERGISRFDFAKILNTYNNSLFLLKLE